MSDAILWDGDLGGIYPTGFTEATPSLNAQSGHTIAYELFYSLFFSFFFVFIIIIVIFIIDILWL